MPILRAKGRGQFILSNVKRNVQLKSIKGWRLHYIRLRPCWAQGSSWLRWHFARGIQAHRTSSSIPPPPPKPQWNVNYALCHGLVQYISPIVLVGPLFLYLSLLGCQILCSKVIFLFCKMVHSVVFTISEEFGAFFVHMNLINAYFCRENSIITLWTKGVVAADVTAEVVIAFEMWGNRVKVAGKIGSKSHQSKLQFISHESKFQCRAHQSCTVRSF